MLRTDTLHAAACKGHISVTIHTGIAAFLPKVRAAMDPSNAGNNFFFPLANGSHLQLDITRADRQTYRIVLHQSQHVRPDICEQISPGWPWKNGLPCLTHRLPGSAESVFHRSRRRRQVGDSYPWSQTPAAGDAILVCPGHGAPKYRWQRDYCRLYHTKSENQLTLFENRSL